MTLEAAPAWRPVPPSVGWILLALAHLSLAGIAIGLWSPVAFPLALTLAAVALYFAMAPDDVVLGIGMALLYANAGAVAVTVHGVPAIAAVGVLGLVAWPLVRAFFDGRPLGPATMPASVPWVVGYLLVMVASSFGAQDREAAADAVLTFLMEGLPLYLLMIATLKLTMGPRNGGRKALKLTRVVLAWNFFLSAFSIAGMCYTVPLLLFGESGVLTAGWYASVCNSAASYGHGYPGLFVCLFISSKLAELLDTFLLLVLYGWRLL